MFITNFSIFQPFSRGKGSKSRRKNIRSDVSGFLRVEICAFNSGKSIPEWVFKLCNKLMQHNVNFCQTGRKVQLITNVIRIYPEAVRHVCLNIHSQLWVSTRWVVLQLDLPLYKTSQVTSISRIITSTRVVSLPVSFKWPHLTSNGLLSADNIYCSVLFGNSTWALGSWKQHGD